MGHRTMHFFYLRIKSVKSDLMHYVFEEAEEVLKRINRTQLSLLQDLALSFGARLNLF